MGALHKVHHFHLINNQIHRSYMSNEEKTLMESKAESPIPFGGISGSCFHHHTWSSRGMETRPALCSATPTPEHARTRLMEITVPSGNSLHSAGSQQCTRVFAPTESTRPLLLEFLPQQNSFSSILTFNRTRTCSNTKATSV